MTSSRRPTVPVIMLAGFALVLGCSTPRRAASDAGTGGSASEVTPAIATATNVERHVRFLAADELQGRDTPSPGQAAAARYIAEALRAAGAEPLTASGDYLQPVALEEVYSPANARLELGGRTIEQGAGALVLNGDSTAYEAPTLYLDYGSEAELAGADVYGKIVVVNAGEAGSNGPQEMFAATEAKRDRVAAAGGLALVELYRSPQLPWSTFVGYFGGPRLRVIDTSARIDLPTLWLDDGSGELVKEMRAADGAPARLTIAARRRRPIAVDNVVGVIRGADPALRDEYVAITAHYDHIGTGVRPGATDTIFNGARDNALGVASLLNVAEVLAAAPPRRSVLLLAVTGEEKGLLGSEYYVAHPLVPLAATVFDLNMDGAGYDDTTAVTLIGFGRTSAQPLLVEGARAAGLEAKDDPAPEQGLFDRSDNVSFARVGIPCVNVAPGMTGFTPEILTYYHQAADEVGTLDFDYVRRYARAIATMARAIADAPEAPSWVEGDVYAGARDASDSKPPAGE